MPQITIKQNINKDAWNWWRACNKISYNVDWKQRVDEKIRNKLVEKTRKQAFIFLIPYLKKLYKKENINAKRKDLKKILVQKQEEIFSRMTKLTARKIYREKFVCFLTTFPRAPYNYQRGYVWMPIMWPQETYVRTFVHELLHFQTYAYWQKQCLEKLSKEEFENLKEALTVVLNEEFMDLIVWQDKGYAMHENIRKQLLKFWKRTKNFDKLVKYGVKFIVKHQTY